jgi:Asp/Glu/hydantoin racemase
MTGSRPRLLIVNPNTNVQVTEWLRDEAARVAAGAFDVVGVNAASGLAAIQTPDDTRKAAQAVADAVVMGKALRLLSWARLEIPASLTRGRSAQFP